MKRRALCLSGLLVAVLGSAHCKNPPTDVDGSPFCPDNCDDGNACTNDVCGEDGSCVHGSNENPECDCFDEYDCDDGDACTTDECGFVSGGSHCVNTVIQGCGGGGMGGQGGSGGEGGSGGQGGAGGGQGGAGSTAAAGGAGGAGGSGSGGSGGSGGGSPLCQAVTSSACAQDPNALGYYQCSGNPNLGGAAPDALGVFLSGSFTVGTDSCSTPANLADCGGPSNCILYVVDSSTPNEQYYLATSCTIELTSDAPPIGTATNIQLVEVTINPDYTWSPVAGGACLECAFADLPAPP